MSDPLISFISGKNFKYQLSIRKEPVSNVSEIKIEPIINTPSSKPRGGFWTSTYLTVGRYASDWVRWCSIEMPDWLEGFPIILEVSPNAKVYFIDSYDDLVFLQNNYPFFWFDKKIKTIDWVKLSNIYDGINLTERGQAETRFGEPNLYGWDCESTLWFRNVFVNLFQYFGKLIRW